MSGGLPEGWADTSFHDVIRTRSGNSKLIKGKLSPSPTEGFFPAYSASGQDVWRDTFDYEGNAIIISAVGARCGKCFQAQGKWSAIANTHIVWPDEQLVDPAFLWKIINDESFWVKGGSAQPFVKVGASFEQTFSLPPLPEQRRIVAKLDRLSARSAAARRHLARVAALAARAKQAILAAAFNDALAPVQTKSVGEIAVHLTSGSRDWAPFYDKGTGVFVLAGNIRPLAFDPHPRRFVDPPRDGRDAKRSKIQKDDILITIVGANTGDLCRVSFALNDYYVCQSVALLRLAETWRARFVELFLNTQMQEGGQLREAIYGQGRPHLSFNDLKAIRVPMPSRPEVEAIVRRIEAAFARIDRLADESARAARLLDRLDARLLAKAFRGELVPQNPADEPATALLARLRETRAAAPKRGRRRTA